jgi:hypothetical protein
VENFVKGIDTIIQELGGVICMNKTLRRLYRQGRREKYNMMYAQVADLDQIADFEQFSVIGLASMAGSDLIWYTPEQNKVKLFIAPENQSLFKVETIKRAVSIYTDYWFGVGFQRAEYVYHNDLDLAL